MSAAISSMRDRDLPAWLESSESLRQSSHATLTLSDSNTRVFVKLVPLTDLEIEPQNWGSTANCFELPPSYGYRIGSAGFGVQRELSVHAMANRWVESGERAQFPLLHGHRIVPIARREYLQPRWPKPWGDHPAVLARQSAIEQSTRCVALFLEALHGTLLQRLRSRSPHALGSGADVTDLEPKLLDLGEFINNRGLRHMDAHFENILYDGEGLYLSDFGLAIADDFVLSGDERAFFERHHHFDQATMMTSLVHAVFTRYAGDTDWPQTFLAFLDGGGAPPDPIPEAERDFLVRRGPLWLAMMRFYARLQDDINSLFPAAEIEQLLLAGAPGAARSSG